MSADNVTPIRPGMTDLPKPLQDYLLEKQYLAAELQSLLERLDADDDMPACISTAARLAEELYDALCPVALVKMLKEKQPT